ncbi:hypothetical protein G3A43_43700 [Paraburkholderia aspalathi]|nr:hypothetical protein [Paraburkholderia aspalathi]
MVQYCFHPLAGQRLEVVRVHRVHDQQCYVVRRADGSTVSVPAWMTELSSAQIRVVAEPRIAVETLLELRRLVSTTLSLPTSISLTGEHDAAPPVSAKGPVRKEQCGAPAATDTASSNTTAAADGAVDAGGGRDAHPGGAR